MGSRTWAFQRTHYVTPKIQDGGFLDVDAKMQKGDFLEN